MAHTAYKTNQALLIGMGGVAANGVDAGLDIEAFAVQVDIAALWAVLLDAAAGGAACLVADKDDVVTGIAEHGFEIVDDATGVAHAAAGDDDGGLFGVGQAVDHGQVLGVGSDGEELFEAQGLAA